MHKMTQICMFLKEYEKIICIYDITKINENNKYIFYIHGVTKM